MEPRSIEEGQVWHVRKTGKLIRVRLFRWSDFGPQIEVENVEDTAVRALWKPEDLTHHCELVQK